MDLRLLKEEHFLGKRFVWKPGSRPWYAKERALKAQTVFEQKLEDGTYLFEDQPCFCGAKDDLLLATRDRYFLYYPLVACRHCGLLRANPRMTSETQKQFYDQEYRPLHGDADDDLNKLHTHWLATQGRQVFEYIARTLGPRKGVVLEIGCNTAAILSRFHDAGCEAYGVDYGSRNIHFGAQRTGIKNLMVGGIERFLALGKKADLIIMSHVLEHMWDLEGELGKAAAALAPNGKLHVAVPGTFWATEKLYSGDISYLLVNAHTYQFSLATLTYVLECAGFERVAGDEQINSVFRVSDKRRPKRDVPAGEFERVTAFLRSLERRYYPRWLLGQALDRVGLKRPVNWVRNKLRREPADARSWNHGPEESVTR